MTNPSKSHVRLAELGLLTVVVIWGVNFSVMKSAVVELDALVFNALRFTLSVAFLGLLVWREEQRGGGMPPKGDRRRSWWPLIGLGMLGHFLYQTTFILGLERTTAGNSALLLGSAPLWTAVIAHFTGWERLVARAWLGLLLCVGGAALISLAHEDRSLESEGFVGDLLTIIAAVGWGAYTAGSKPLLRSWSSLGLAWRSMVAATPLIWLAAVPRLGGMDWSVLGWEAWAAILYSGFLSTGVAYVLWNYGIVHVGASRTAVYANLLPAVAIVVAVFWLGEGVTLPQVLGGLLVVGGVLWVRRVGTPKAGLVQEEGRAAQDSTATSNS